MIVNNEGNYTADTGINGISFLYEGSEIEPDAPVSVELTYHAYELVKNGSIGAIRLGKKIIIPKPALVDFCRNERNYLVLLPK